MEERKGTLIMRRVEVPPPKSEPELQLGGPQSGFPPPYIIGQDLAPYLIVGMDFGSLFCRVCTFSNGAPRAIQPHQYSSLAEDVLRLGEDERGLAHSLKVLLAEECSIEHSGYVFSPVDLVSQMFRDVKSTVETNTHRMLAKAVISVPACYTHRQRQLVAKAASEADVAVLGLINEPTAAMLDVCFRHNLANGRYLVVSVGAFSFEATLVHVQNKLIETKAIKGNCDLSGMAFNSALANIMQEQYASSDLDALVVDVEQVKVQLSSGPVKSGGTRSALISVQGITHELTQRTVRTWMKDYVCAIESVLSSLLDSAHSSYSDVDGIILAGAGAKLWLLQEILRENFLKAPIFWGDVSAGAAIQAALAVRQTKDWVVWDALACPIYVAQGAHMRQIVSANSPVPINGHALLSPGEDGLITSRILQIASYSGKSDPVHVASVEIVEELPTCDEETTVDLAIHVTSDGLLQFSARHKSLDVNLTVKASEPERERNVVFDLAAKKAVEVEPASGEQQGCDSEPVPPDAPAHEGKGTLAASKENDPVIEPDKEKDPIAADKEKDPPTTPIKEKEPIVVPDKEKDPLTALDEAKDLAAAPVKDPVVEAHKTKFRLFNSRRQLADPPAGLSDTEMIAAPHKDNVPSALPRSDNSPLLALHKAIELLDPTNPEQAAAMELALQGLARAYAICGDYELVAEAYNRMLNLPLLTQQQLLRHYIMYTEFLVLVNDDSSTLLIDWTLDLGLRIGTLTDKNKVKLWRDHLNVIRGEKSLIPKCAFTGIDWI